MAKTTCINNGMAHQRATCTFPTWGLPSPSEDIGDFWFIAVLSGPGLSSESTSCGLCKCRS